MSKFNHEQLAELYENGTPQPAAPSQTAAHRPCYNLSEEAFDLLEDVQAALHLLGMMAVEQTTGDIPAAPLGRTVLLLGNQLDQVIGDCQYNARANVKPLKPEGVA